jgi:hypothetical protein
MFLQNPHGVTSQKTQIFIVTAEETLNLIYRSYNHAYHHISHSTYLFFLKLFKYIIFVAIYCVPRSVHLSLVIANVVPSSPVLVILIMVATRFYKNSVLTRFTRRNIPEDGIIHSQCHANLKSYILSCVKICHSILLMRQQQGLRISAIISGITSRYRQLKLQSETM